MKNEKNVLISFISYDQDSYDVKYQDNDFMYSHRQALFEHKKIKEDERDQRTVPLRELRERYKDDKENPIDLRPYLTRTDIWRPSVALCMGYEHRELAQGRVQAKLFFDTIYIIHDKGNPKTNHDKVIKEILEDAEVCCKKRHCELRSIIKIFENPWDHSEVYKYLYHLFQGKDFHQPDCSYFVNIANGTNVIKNCLFLLTHEQVIDAKRIMPHPWNDPRTRNYRWANGGYQIDDPAQFSEIYADIRKEVLGNEESIQKSIINQNIETIDEKYLKLLAQIDKVARVTQHPILLTGPTGAGKTQIAENIFEIRKQAGLLGKDGKLVHENCATLGGDPNIVNSILFGQVEGSHSTANKDTTGLLELADGGVLFLDEIGTLGLSEQAMLLTAIERKQFKKLGGTKYVNSNFLLVCGTNTNLWEAVENGKFRRDLFERINLWHFQLPSLYERRDEIMQQCKVYLDHFYPAKHKRKKVRFADQKAESAFQTFIEEDYEWPGNFRELNAILERMCDMSVANKITKEVVEEEIERTRKLRESAEESTSGGVQANDAIEVQQAPSKTKLREIIGDDAYERLPPIDRVQLDYVVEISRQCHSLKELGRKLYGRDVDRGKPLTMLEKHGLKFNRGALSRK